MLRARISLFFTSFYYFYRIPGFLSNFFAYFFGWEIFYDFFLFYECFA
ncbi:hypothetical protein SLEP1_g5646 [Rubroshorea leprosula]|uniref:Uncharacterized protein n=1 Tax=Rubroshorea leprosula TaxID=152421 RepID=A0AAV5I0L7_9ROSI|nr:hypothetical protein SLEP1_g5646 [Rubroshorea leprosula]